MIAHPTDLEFTPIVIPVGMLSIAEPVIAVPRVESPILQYIQFDIEPDFIQSLAADGICLFVIKVPSVHESRQRLRIPLLVAHEAYSAAIKAGARTCKLSPNKITVGELPFPFEPARDCIDFNDTIAANPLGKGEHFPSDAIEKAARFYRGAYMMFGHKKEHTAAILSGARDELTVQIVIWPGHSYESAQLGLEQSPEPTEPPQPGTRPHDLN
ncbi:hypothetical protein [Anatilimnocola floriformis]|uniref:hypothetical protein n=1 Tax=Anatilimnocola floriformis TaxID=2948575 RepID=UPI0020C4983A|nr:hypothetical protein [Anatilimnocola floriformis]